MKKIFQISTLIAHKLSPSSRKTSAKIGLFAAIVALIVGVLAPLLMGSANVFAAVPKNNCTPAQIQATKRWWYFYKAGMDFNINGSAPITSANPVSGATGEGTTVISDTSGELLFWTNGISVYNRNQQIMPNGDDIAGSATATQSAVAFPSIADPNIYYIAVAGVSYVDGGSVGSRPLGVFYSVVDMRLNGGLGDVVSGKKAVKISDIMPTEAITAYPNATGDGFWVVVAEAGTNKLWSFGFDANGPINGGVPVESDLSQTVYSGYGSLVLSPQMDKMALVTLGNWLSTTTYPGSIIAPANTPNRAFLMSVDGATGKLTEIANWATGSMGSPRTDGGAYGAEFSPDEQYLYVSTIYTAATSTDALLRYSISSGDSATIKASETPLLTAGQVSVGTLKLGPDGKIYIGNASASASLSVIDAPDATSPQVGYLTVSLPTGASNSFGLPQFVTGCPGATPTPPPTTAPPTASPAPTPKPTEPPKPPATGVYIATTSIFAIILVGLATLFATRKLTARKANKE